MATRYSIEAVFKAIDQMTMPLQKMTLQNKKFVNSMKTDFAQAQRSVKNFAGQIRSGLQIGFGLAIAGMGLAIKKGIDFANDLVEVQNVVDVTFRDSAAEINAWSKAAINSFGLSELQAKKFTGTLGAMIKSSGISGDMMTKMSTDLSGLSGDFASFFNLPVEEAFNKIRSGISGETEPLKQLGINMSVASLQAFALSKGINKSFNSMTQAEKTLLRYNYLMETTKDQQGDFNRTLQTSFANQKRVLSTKFTQKLAEAMSKLLPKLIDVYKTMNKWLDSIDTEKIAGFVSSVFDMAGKAISIFITAIKVIKPFLPFILGILIAWQAYQKAMLIAAAAQMIFNAVMSANPIGIIIIAIGLLIGIIYLLVKNWDKVKAAVVKAVEVSIEWIKKMLTKAVELWDKFKGIALVIAAPFTILIEVLRSIIQHWDDIKKGFTEGGILGGILAIGKAILSGILAPIQSFLELVSKIPGVGNLAAGGAEKINQLRSSLFADTNPNTPMTPADRSTIINKETTNRGELIIKDETGRAEMNGQHSNKNMNLKLQTSGGF